LRAGVSGNDFTGHEVGARRRLAPTEHAVNQRRSAEGELWQPRFLDRTLRMVKEYNDFIGHEVGARRRLAPTEHAVNQRRGAEGELWQPWLFDRALRTVMEYNEKVEFT
jgi:hypothetical protein